MEGSAAAANAIDLVGSPDSVNIDGDVHLLPCNIKYDGPCSVSDYFKPKPSGTEMDGLAVQEAYFRGRKLQGTSVSIPQGYTGFVLGKKATNKTSAPDASAGDKNFWETKAKFGSITYWNHEILPSQDDSFLRSLHWLSVAEVLHKPVTNEDLVLSSIPNNDQMLKNGNAAN